MDALGAGSFWTLLMFLAFCAGAAATGVLFRPGAWYESLAKPAWTPPNWLFGPAWTVLYIAMAVAGWLVWSAQGGAAATAVWFGQLALNAAWSWLFFGLRRMDLAFGDVLLLWLTIVAFIVLAWPVSELAAALFVPYVLWVTYAAALNLAVWRANPGPQQAAR